MVEKDNNENFTLVTVIQIVKRNSCGKKHDRTGSSSQWGYVHISNINQHLKC